MEDSLLQRNDSTPGASQAYEVVYPTGQHNRVHHSYIWLNSLVAFLSVGAVTLATNAGSLVPFLLDWGGSGSNIALGILLLLLVGVLVYGLIVGISLLAYKNLSFVFEEREFSLYSGIITKRRVHVPYARVQSVNHRQSLVQRIAGVCTVEIDTAGGANNKAVRIPYVTLGSGEAIRRDLFVRKASSAVGAAVQVQQAATSGAWQAPVPPPMVQAGSSASAEMQGNVLDTNAGSMVADFRGVYGDEAAGMEPVSFERALSNKELLFASVSHSGIEATVIATLLMMAVGVAPLVVFAPKWGWVGLAVVPFAVLFTLVVVAFSVGMVALSFGGFAVRRRGSRIEVERGILQRDFSGMDIDRIQSVVVKQSFVRRCMGYCEVSLGRVSAGSGSENSNQAKLNTGGLVVHPFLRLDQVDSLLDGLLPEYTDRPVAADFKSLPDVALRRGMVRRCIWRNSAFWATLTVAAAQIVANVLAADRGVSRGYEGLGTVNLLCVVLYGVAAVSTVLIAVGTVWWKRGSGFAMNARYLAVCNDGLTTETSYFPRQKVQDVFTRTNPFQRMARTTTINALTAAGVGGSYTTLWDVTEEDGEAWLEWLKPKPQASVSPVGS
ncbi:MAG: PH domain-containing protein [Eggerthellaceae bacterium]|nr:PH domain-containing protein [Eggerthellaceae bacterium]